MTVIFYSSKTYRAITSTAAKADTMRDIAKRFILFYSELLREKKKLKKTNVTFHLLRF